MDTDTNLRPCVLMGISTIQCLSCICKKCQWILVGTGAFVLKKVSTFLAFTLAHHEN